MGLIKGIDVTLYERTQNGTDSLNMPIYTVSAVTVENVLVEPNTSSNVSDELSKDSTTYTLGIPKGDSHAWENSEVEFTLNSRTVKGKTSGTVIEGIEDLIPLDWNRKVTVVCYE